MIIHRKPSSPSSSSSASAASAKAKAKIETHASQPRQQKEDRNDDEDEKTRQGFDRSKREVAGSFDYTSTTIKGRSSTATATHDVSEREKSSMTVRSESTLSWSAVWGIVAVYLFLSTYHLCLLQGILWLVLLSTLMYQIVVYLPEIIKLER